VIKRVEKMTYIEHVYRVTGGAWGANQVNNNYEVFLNNVLGSDVMDELNIIKKTKLWLCGTRPVITVSDTFLLTLFLLLNLLVSLLCS
jgi:hypothetical protein